MPISFKSLEVKIKRGVTSLLLQFFTMQTIKELNTFIVAIREGIDFNEIQKSELDFYGLLCLP